jgi:hypothetical protein
VDDRTRRLSWGWGGGVGAHAWCRGRGLGGSVFIKGLSAGGAGAMFGPLYPLSPFSLEVKD